MIVCSESPLEEVLFRKTTLNLEKRDEIISWVNAYVETVSPDIMILLDVSNDIQCIYEKCYNTLDKCMSTCNSENLMENVVEQQRENIKMVNEELRKFSISNTIPLRSCSFNLRLNVLYPHKKPITFLRSIVAVSNNEEGKPSLVLVTLQDITNMTNAIQGVYFEIKHARQQAVDCYSLKCLESVINAKIKSGVTLTKREDQVLQLLINGHTSLGISKELFIAKTTVDKHRQNLMRKYNVTNVTQLIRKYLQSVA
ncbi:MAG: hypothetical protein COB60_01730 [Flavobacteriaceae bacterium]|nr:MAG: hypothetical protein COB60_01730 [Flavobacteriaceae bacterium]